jgi:hypothetical protein
MDLKTCNLSKFLKQIEGELATLVADNRGWDTESSQPSILQRHHNVLHRHGLEWHHFGPSGVAIDHRQTIPELF